MNSICVLLMFVGVTAAYNLEDRLPLYKVGDDGSMFGFSVAMHKTSNSLQGKLVFGFVLLIV